MATPSALACRMPTLAAGGRRSPALAARSPAAAPLRPCRLPARRTTCLASPPPFVTTSQDAAVLEPEAPPAPTVPAGKPATSRKTRWVAPPCLCCPLPHHRARRR